MNDKKQAGLIKISESVVASVVAVAAAEVEGVSAVGGRKPEAISKKAGKVVRMEFDGNAVSIDLSVVVKYGHSIPDIGAEIQDNVTLSVEAMTGLRVKAVNVHCTGVAFTKEKK